MLTEHSDSLAAERRIWRMPDVAASYAFGGAPIPEPGVVDDVVIRLRLEAGELINRLLDRTEAKKALALHIEEADGEFRLRPWGGSDQASLAAMLDNPALWTYMPEAFPGRVTEDLAGALISVSNDFPGRHQVRAVEWRGQPIGQVRLQFDSSPYPHSAEISYWLGERFWRRGLATGFVSLFTSQCFNNHHRLERIFAKVLEGNRASMRVLEKAGFRHESFKPHDVVKEGHRHNAHIFSVCRSDYVLGIADRVANAAPAQHRAGPAHAAWMLLGSGLSQMVQLGQIGEALIAFA